MKKLFIIITFVFFYSTLMAQQATDLFFSEYVEGSSLNKALEIFNPTGEIINLDNYKIVRFKNGGTEPEEMPIQLNNGDNVINPYSTIIITHGQIEPSDFGQIDPELYAMADMTSPTTYPNPMFFNGDDAIALVKNDNELIDLIGKIGEDPGAGWCDDEALDYMAGDNADLAWTANHTIVRKVNVYSGITSDPSNFNPALEWDTLPNNDWSNLGTHSYLYSNFATFQVIDENGNIANALIDINDQQLITNSDGIDSIPLLSGSYLFVISRAGFAQYTDVLEMEDKDTTLLIQLPQSDVYTTTFTVKNELEEPISNASIWIGGDLLTTDSEGVATIELGNGTWAYEISASEYQTINQSITVDGEPTNEAITLLQTTYTFDIYVHHNYQPIENASITLNNEVGNTDAEGNYSAMLLNGTYSLSISKDGFESFTTEIEMNSEPNSISVELNKYYTATFYVLFASQAIEGAKITIDTIEQYTDEMGVATFDLFSGNYNYTVETDLYNSLSGTIEIQNLDIDKVINLMNIQNLDSKFHLYPNPTKSEIVIESEGQGLATFFNSTGQIIDSKNFNGKLYYSFDKPGIYLVQLNNNKKTETLKIVVE